MFGLVVAATHKQPAYPTPTPTPTQSTWPLFLVNIAPFGNRQTPASRSVRITPSRKPRQRGRVFCSSSKSLLYLAACLPTMLVHAHHMTPSSLVPPIRS